MDRCEVITRCVVAALALALAAFTAAESFGLIHRECEATLTCGGEVRK